MAWMSVDPAATEQWFSFTNEPASAPWGQGETRAMAAAPAQIVGAIGTDAGTTFLLTASFSPTKWLYRYSGPPAAPTTFLNGELEGFEGVRHAALWDPVEKAWWVAWVVGNGSTLRAARICGP
jgi:hypothetical protein